MRHILGYARVSATDQNLPTQVEDLTRAGRPRIFQEKVSGTRTSSPALTELLAAVRERDAMVNRLVRLGRNTVHTIQLMEEFNRRGVHFWALDLGIDSRIPAGKMVIGVFSSFNRRIWRASRWPSTRASIWAGPLGVIPRSWPR